MSDPKLERLIAYLQENTGRYSLQSLRDALLRQGHDPALVEEAFAECDRRSRLGLSPAPSPAPAVPDGAPADADQVIPASREPRKRPSDTAASVILKVGCGMLLGILVIIAVIILVVGGFCGYLFYQAGHGGPH